MKRIIMPNKTLLEINKTYTARPLEEKLRLLQKGEKLDGEELEKGQLIYTEKSQGVKPETNIRTDKWEVAQKVSNSISKTIIAKGGIPADEGDGTKESSESAEAQTGDLSGSI